MANVTKGLALTIGVCLAAAVLAACDPYPPPSVPTETDVWVEVTPFSSIRTQVHVAPEKVRRAPFDPQECDCQLVVPGPRPLEHR